MSTTKLVSKRGARLGESTWVALLTSILAASAGFPALAAVEIEVGRSGTGDDYVCWAPVEARARLTPPQPQSQIVKIISTAHDPLAMSGEVAFVDAPEGGLRADMVVPSATIEIELPADGSWRTFYVLGTVASTNDQDVAIVAANDVGDELARHALMVRVRKNAQTLSDGERDRFLNAFVQAAERDEQFAKYWGIHTDAIRLAHQMAFLPWHRVFLINLERELQIEDPSVALPYWEFDKPAPDLFTEDFIGRVDPASDDPTLVRFAVPNPLARWRLTDLNVSPLRRIRNGDSDTDSAINKDFMEFDQHGLMTQQIFGPYHGDAHVFIGGLLGDIRRSPADPLFFLLHANVDRAWAAWERFYGRFDQHDLLSYALQGSHAGTSTFPFGNYVDDTMWPWDGIVRPTEPVTLTLSPVTLPPNPGPGGGLSGVPKVGDTLDYLDLAGAGAYGGFCYDSIPYGVGSVAPFWTP